MSKMGNQPVQLTGNNVTGDGSIKIAPLSKDIDSFDVAKMSPDAPQNAFDIPVSATTTSTEKKVAGYRNIAVSVIVTGAGTWDITIQGSITSLGNYSNLNDYRGTLMKFTGVTSAGSGQVFEGVFGYVKIVATLASGTGTCQVKIQGMN